jgi:hypothetical protein
VTLVAVRQEGPSLIEGYRSVVGDGPIRVLEALAQRLRGHRVVMVNSTATGGGVAEILHRLVRLMNELDVPTTWEVMPATRASTPSPRPSTTDSTAGRPRSTTTTTTTTWR